jgi:hypothetical protein
VAQKVAKVDVEDAPVLGEHSFWKYFNLYFN